MASVLGSRQEVAKLLRRWGLPIKVLSAAGFGVLGGFLGFWGAFGFQGLGFRLWA